MCFVQWIGESQLSVLEEEDALVKCNANVAIQAALFDNTRETARLYFWLISEEE